MAKKNGSTLPAELSRLHRLTHAESDLVFGYRVLSPEGQLFISEMIKAGCGISYTVPSADNVVNIRNHATD